MNNVMFLPERYKNLERDELIRAFFSEYYELVIAVDDNAIIESMIDYVKKSNNHIKCDNELLWKHLWMSYFMFVMQRMKYNYCYDIISKEKVRLNDSNDETFLRFIAIVNVSSKLLTRGDAVIEAPRLLDGLLGDRRCQDDCGFIFERKSQIFDLTNEYSNVFVFNADFFNNNQYFDIGNFVLYTLTMLCVNANLESTTIFRCISGVLKNVDNSKLEDFCNKLYNILRIK